MCYKLPRNHTSECIKCKRRFKRLTSENICYYCHINKYNKPPKEWEPVGKYRG